MPQMFPLNWMIMMLLSIFVLLMYSVMVYYLKFSLNYKVSFCFFGKKLVNWEW